MKITEGNKGVLRDAIKNKNRYDELVRYVPFRLIRPFFKELRGLKDYQVNNRITIVAEDMFEVRKPLYKFNQTATEIIIHPEWATYIQANYRIIRGWAAWGWLQYMQRNNRNTPALANKLFPPRERESMQFQISYWEEVLKNCADFRCVYSDKILTLQDMSLDHYLPWSFVAHNQLWNLVPVPKSVNSSKSDRIPNNIYFEKFVKTQHLGITVFYKSCF
jgi:HNH endonuclease